jgi:hypothetical protein
MGDTSRPNIRNEPTFRKLYLRPGCDCDGNRRAAISCEHAFGIIINQYNMILNIGGIGYIGQSMLLNQRREV